MNGKDINEARVGRVVGATPRIVILLMYLITIHLVMRILLLITSTTKTLLCSHVIT